MDRIDASHFSEPTPARRKALPPMALPYPIRHATGRTVARPDIAFPSVRLGVEAHVGVGAA